MDYSDKNIKMEKTVKDEEIETSPKSQERTEEPGSSNELKLVDDDEESLSPKNKKDSQHVLNNRNKRRILKHIVETGCGENTFDELKKIMKKVVPASIEDYLNTHAKKSQMHVHEECGSELLSAMDEWIEYIKGKDLAKNCQYELPLVLKTIAKVEKHPKTGEKGINFEHLYLFLANVMNGEGSTELNPATREFLAETYMELMEVVESEQGQRDLELLEGKIKSTTKVISSDEPNGTYIGSLDPLSLENKLGV